MDARLRKNMPTLLRTFFLSFLSVISLFPQADPVLAHVSATDFRGHVITLDKPAKRIVCLIESALSGLYMLGVAQRVVGVSANVYNTEVYHWYARLDGRIKARQLPAPGNWDFVSLEGVIALRPDLVIIWADQKETIAALAERGIPVFAVSLRSKEDVYREIEALGTLTGTSLRAQELITSTREELNAFIRRLPKSFTPTTVYYMWAQGQLETSCGGSTVNDLIELAGGRNVCGATASEHMVVNLERILRWSPQLIVMWYNERLSPQDILNDPQWKSITAIHDGRVHEFPELFLCDLWTLKFQHAVKMVAKWAHPDLFADIDLAREQAEMLKTLYGPTIEGE